VHGEIDTLRALLAAHPSLITERSGAAHRSTLLHYVAANGFEDVRQVTPANVLEVAHLLLDAGADVHAESEAYGGGSTVLALVATSTHPRRAGVQLALLDLLIEHGATVGGITMGSAFPRYALANGCPEAAVHLVRRFANTATLYGAAGLGDLAAVTRHFDSASDEERSAALVLAAMCEQLPVVDWLLAREVPQREHDGMYPLHWAAGNGDVPMVERLLTAGGDLEACNEYGGTVLSNTVWFGCHRLPDDFARRDFPRLIDRLLALGARIDWYPELPAELEWVKARAVRDGSANA
jgi:ankyrin repeat protein